MKFAFIRAQEVAFPVVGLCRVMGVSRSGYYAWKRRRPSRRAQADASLHERIRKAYKAGRGTYGSRRVRRELLAQGTRLGRRRVARLMRQANLRVARKRRYRLTTDSKHAFETAPNLLARNFSADAPDTVWVTDITYVPTHEGWLYLAAIVDLFSRRVVGWAMSERITRALCLDALAMAVGTRRPAPGLIHHSDRGSQYASHDYRKALTKAGMRCSMSRKGDCFDNAVAESFFATLKGELVDQADFLTREQARKAIFEYIEVFYNRQRRHSTLGYVSPVEFERRDLSPRLAA